MCAVVCVYIHISVRNFVIEGLCTFVVDIRNSVCWLLQVQQCLIDALIRWRALPPLTADFLNIFSEIAILSLLLAACVSCM